MTNPKIEKKLRNKDGDILIRLSPSSEGRECYDGMPVVEALCLNSGDACYVVVTWELRKADNDWIIEAHECCDRLTETCFDDGVMEQTFYWGRKMANLALDFIYNIIEQ